MTINIAAFMGSPVPDGNTAKLLNTAVQACKEKGCNVRVIDVTALHFSGCMEYMYCRSNEGCMIEDDGKVLLNAVRNADGIILAFPVMCMGVPGMMKSFFDRMQPLFMAKYVRKEPMITAEQKKWRKTMLISIGGMNVANDFDGVKISVDTFCNSVDSPLYTEILQNDMDTIRDVDTKPELIESVRSATLDMCQKIIENKEKFDKITE